MRLLLSLFSSVYVLIASSCQAVSAVRWTKSDNDLTLIALYTPSCEAWDGSRPRAFMNSSFGALGPTPAVILKRAGESREPCFKEADDFFRLEEMVCVTSISDTSLGLVKRNSTLYVRRESLATLY